MAGDWSAGKAAASSEGARDCFDTQCQVCCVTSMFRQVFFILRNERRYSNALGCFLHIYFSFLSAVNSRNGLRYAIVTIPKSQ